MSRNKQQLNATWLTQLATKVTPLPLLEFKTYRHHTHTDNTLYSGTRISSADPGSINLFRNYTKKAQSMTLHINS